jgi:hypothetical protein
LSDVGIKQIVASEADYEDIFRALTLRLPDPPRPLSRMSALVRYNALILLNVFLDSRLQLAIFVTMRSDPRNGKGAAVARPRGTTAEKLRVVADAAPEACAMSVASKGDPRLVTLVLLLAPQAAQDFVQTETDSRKRERLPK